MKQKIGSHNCIAVVAAMATDSTPEEFESFIEGPPPYCDYDFYRFLVFKGYVVGFGFDIQDTPIKGISIDFRYSINTYPAYVVVESETYKDTMHALYWDSKKVHDPNPSVKDGRSLADYKIHLWFPINKVDTERKLI